MTFAANSDDATVRAAIGALGPAIELADLDSADGRRRGPARARHLAAPCHPWAEGCVPRRREARRAHRQALRNGKDAAVPADLEIGTGTIVDTVRHVADVTAALGDGLRAGQFIICGAITGPMFLEPGETELDFTLAPIGSVSVRLAW